MTQEPADLDAVDLLLIQHAQIEELFRAVLYASGDRRRDKFDQLARLLVVHETAEQELVHPLARERIDDGDVVIAARLAEERVALERLSKLRGLGTDAPEFLDRLVALRDMVLAHAKHEERYEFPALRYQDDPDALERLAAAVRRAEAAAPPRP